ncbi:hypothetical protein [Clostridium sp. C8-1-8]|uniref:hypothetical protein n=1 Tax=Clostridium sp. C8-1-8 TaxID=2698831 RepID=UPI0013711C80|nr:hypothetical protein [Clostridium sp. C8-1-8]
MTNPIYLIKNKYLAQALSWMGFNYKKIGDEYAFINTEEFSSAYASLLQLKKQCGTYN